MIEINLVPDVKQELIKAKQVRTLVVSGAIVVGIVAVGIVILLALYKFGVQEIRSSVAKSDIEKGLNELKETPDLANMLTIQNQLASVSELHDQKNISSRIFELLVAINPSAPNQVTFTSFKFDAQNTLIRMEAQTQGGYTSADVFKKMVQAVKFDYQPNLDSKAQELPIVSEVVLSNLSYGEDSVGVKVLRFSVDMKYSPELFAATSKNVRIVRPGYENVTDSFKYLPESLFGNRARDLGEEQ